MTPELTDATRPTPWTVYQIDVHVQWDEAREVYLATLRTVSTVPQTTTGTQPTTAGQTTPATPPTTLPGTTTPPVAPGQPAR